MTKVLITGHRGMGVTAKRRDHFIDGAPFFPENSLAAFVEAIEQGADALECDIHVSHDNVAVVIHGDKIRDYGYEIDTENKSISIPSDKKRLSTSDFNTISSKFRLKTFSPYEQALLELHQQKKIAEKYNDKNAIKEISEKIETNWEKYIKTDPDFNHIPPLESLLYLCATKNEERLLSGRPTLKLNIELKGANSGHATLATIAKYNKKAWDSGNFIPTINPEDIILLGRKSIGEIIVAKSILVGAQKFLDETENLTQKQYNKIKRTLLSPLMGTPEQIIIYGNPKDSEKTNEKRIPQELSQSKIAKKIIETHSLYNGIKKGAPELSILRGFLSDILFLREIRTNVMLSTGDLYGKDAILSDDEDFDLKLGIQKISAEGKDLVLENLIIHDYDGIDISLFDFEEETYKVLSVGIDDLKQRKRKPILGATASNWKGVKEENSPIKPAEAVFKAHCIAQTLGIDIILKVDEPGFFKALYEPILNGKLTLVEPEEMCMVEVEDEDLDTPILNQEYYFTLADRNWQKFIDLEKKNYDMEIAYNMNVLSNSAKPPRGQSKKSFSETPPSSGFFSPSTGFFSPPNGFFSPPNSTLLSQALSSENLFLDTEELQSQTPRFSLSHSFDENLSPVISIRSASFPVSHAERKSYDPLSETEYLNFSFNNSFSLKNLTRLLDEAKQEEKSPESDSSESNKNKEKSPTRSGFFSLFK